MQYRQLGQWGARLSVLGLGSYLTIGFKVDEETSRQMVRAAYEGGINWIDTANAYNRGGAETVLGRCLGDYPRSDWFIITKVWAPMGPGPNDRGLSAKHIREQCEASLKRLQLDYLDLYMCHRPDPDTPLVETVRAMEDLAHQGKILYWGVSEWPAWRMAEANHIARELGARPIAVNEPRYSLLWRYPEAEVFPVTLSHGIGNVVFSPLAHGMLTGKYAPGLDAPAGTRAADPDQNAVIRQLYWNEENKLKGQELAALAGELGTTAATLALAWILRHPAVTGIILGTRTVAQLLENLGAVDLALPEEAVARLEALYPAPVNPAQV